MCGDIGDIGDVHAQPLPLAELGDDLSETRLPWLPALPWLPWLVAAEKGFEASDAELVAAKRESADRHREAVSRRVIPMINCSRSSVGRRLSFQTNDQALDYDGELSIINQIFVCPQLNVSHNTYRVITYHGND